MCSLHFYFFYKIQHPSKPHIVLFARNMEKIAKDLDFGQFRTENLAEIQLFQIF